MRQRIRTTLAQREAMKLLRVIFAERGYRIFAIARWYRRHHLDFIAIPKDVPQKFIVVHPMRDSSISVRPYCLANLYPDLPALLARVRADCPIRWNKRQLPRTKDFANFLHGYLSPSAKKAYARLVGMSTTLF